MDRFVCIHGHFYQPPRENPWLEAIEVQDSAYPFHDWNERVTSECYAPNRASRILDDKGNIIEIVNNYSKISFNFGPTLLSWLEKKSPDVYDALLEADKESQKTFSGHGSALAQLYNHMIMPLANEADKRTQVIWGLRDFQFRFGRDPEGMWLPETAVNIECLEILAEHGIRFTLLCPDQAFRVRKIGGRAWKETKGGSIDPTMPYLLNLPSGKTLNIFFYDNPISRSVAFEGVLSKGELLAQRLIGSFSPQRSWTPLAHIATDGETYGHHHRYGEMALSYALRIIETEKLATLTNYGEFLEKFPPTHEIEIIENTSWSCAHGVERWKSDCGCHMSGGPGLNQLWRAPLRRALDWLRDTLHQKFEEDARSLLNDPWKARNDYISILLNRTPDTFRSFLNEHAHHPLNEIEKIRTLKLLELQRHAMLMYTSCGWFFDDLAGIEAVQILQYAGRATQLAQELWGDHIENNFLDRLAEAKSNFPAEGNGRDIFQKKVKPSMVDLEKVTAHYALTSLFEAYEEKIPIYCYAVERKDYKLLVQGKARLALGKTNTSSEITGESKTVVFCALHLGDHNLSVGTQEFRDEGAYQLLVKEISASFDHTDLPNFFRTMDKYFGPRITTLKVLFTDEQRKVLNLILDSTLAEAEAVYRQIYEHHAPLLRFLSELNMPLPKPFSTAAGFALNASLCRTLESEEPNFEQITALLEEAKRSGVVLDAAGLSYTLGKSIERLAARFQDDPAQPGPLHLLDTLVGLALTPPLSVNLWTTQNIYYGLAQTALPLFEKKADNQDDLARGWVRVFHSLGEKLKVKI